MEYHPNLPPKTTRQPLEVPMTKLLFVNSSIFGKHSKSRTIAQDFIEIWRRDHPGTVVVERDVGSDPLPHITAEKMGAIMTPADKRTAQQAAAVSHADGLIEEVEAADVIVLAAPMYNFSIPSTLKAWIDHIARAGRTFVYTEGPAKPLDFQEPYLRGMLGFLGLSDVTFVHVEGLAVSPGSAAEGLAKAREKIASLLGRAAAA